MKGILLAALLMVFLAAVFFSLPERSSSPPSTAEQEAAAIIEEGLVQESEIRNTPVANTGATVLVTEQGFSPPHIVVKEGTTVTWKNLVDRGVLLNDFSKKFQYKFGEGETFSYTYEIEGVYPYQDGIMNWRGVVEVVR